MKKCIRFFIYVVLLLATGQNIFTSVPGSLDPSFNPNGALPGMPGAETIPASSFGVGTSMSSASALQIQSNGAIVVVGNAYPGGVQSMAIIRLTSSGSLDPSFNGTGVVIIPPTAFGAGASFCNATAVQIQSNGAIVVAGNADPGGVISAIAITRLTSSGALDPSFNGTGLVTIAPTAFGVDAEAFGVQIQSNGAIVVVGNADPNSMAIARLTSSGALDSSFNGTGLVTIAPSAFGAADAEAYGVQIQSNGAIVVAGYTFLEGIFSMAIARLTSSGALDSSFNGTGVVTIASTAFGAGAFSSEAFGVQIQSNGAIVVAGAAFLDVESFSMAIVRLTSSGSLDTSFNGTGVVTIAPTAFGAGASFSEASGVQIQSNGAIVAAGVADPGGVNNSMAIVRLTSSGALDSSFNGTGVVTIAPIAFGAGASFSEASGVQIQSNGAIVVAGYTYDQTFISSMAIARLIGGASIVSALSQALLAKYGTANG